MSHDYSKGLPGGEPGPPASASNEPTAPTAATEASTVWLTPLPSDWTPRAPRSFSRRRLVNKLAFTLVPILALAGVLWAVNVLPKNQLKDDLSARAVTLLNGLFDADPAAFSALLEEKGDNATYFLTAQTARTALGDDIRVTALPEDVTLVHGTSTTVHATVHTAHGEMPVDLSFTRKSKDDDTWEPQPLHLPRIAMALATTDPSAMKPILDIYNRKLTLGSQQPAAAVNQNRYYLWPGVTQVTLPTEAPFRWSTASMRMNFPLSLDGRIGADLNFAIASAAASLTPEFKKQVLGEVSDSVKACEGTTAKIPAACPLSLRKHLDSPDKLRNVQRTVLRLPGGPEFFLSSVPGRAGFFSYADSNASILTKGERLNDGAWYAFEDVTPLRLYGTATYRGGQVTIEPDDGTGTRSKIGVLAS